MLIPNGINSTVIVCNVTSITITQNQQFNNLTLIYNTNQSALNNPLITFLNGATFSGNLEVNLTDSLPSKSKTFQLISCTQTCVGKFNSVTIKQQNPTSTCPMQQTPTCTSTGLSVTLLLKCGLSKGEIIGIAVGVPCGVIILVAIAVLGYCKAVESQRERRSTENEMNELKK